MRLGEPDTDVLLEERGQPDRGLGGQLGCDPRVEQAPGPELVVAVQDSQIVIGVVEDFFDLGVGEQAAQWREVGHRERVDDRRRRAGRELNEVDAVHIAVEARRFRVHGDQGLAAERRDGLGDRGGGAEVPVHALFFFTELLQPGGDLLERLGEGLVELGVRGLGRAAEGVSSALARGARRVPDVIGRNPHGHGSD